MDPDPARAPATVDGVGKSYAVVKVIIFAGFLNKKSKTVPSLLMMGERRPPDRVRE
jgi:hypothetical protein